jgi:predicted nucleotidyltransferase
MQSPDTTDRQMREDATTLATALAIYCETMLGANFLGFYLIGSLAHGGFNRRYSDIDIALISEHGLDDAQRAAIDDEAQRLAPTLASRVSLFWSNRSFSLGRFPPLDRLDYIDRAVPLRESEKISIDRPDLSEIQQYLRGAPFEQWAARGAQFADASALAPDDRKTYLKTHLYPARFSYSWITGQIASNDDALTYLRDHPLDGLDLTLLGRALQIRHEAADPDPLFADRMALPAQYAACAKLMESR